MTLFSSPTSMMNASPSFGFDSGIALLWILHVLGALSVLIGFLFLVMLVAKKLHEKQLKTWGLSLLIGGGLVCLFTLISLPVHRIQMGNMMRQNTDRNHMMPNGMMMQNLDIKKMNSSDSMNMSMNDMSMMLQGKAGDAFDQAFLEGMIPHHQGAIEMARAAQASAKHAEIQKMAADIIATQQKEIDMMKQWQADWGYIQ